MDFVFKMTNFGKPRRAVARRECAFVYMNEDSSIENQDSSIEI